MGDHLEIRAPGSRLGPGTAGPGVLRPDAYPSCRLPGGVDLPSPWLRALPRGASAPHGRSAGNLTRSGFGPQRPAAPLLRAPRPQCRLRCRARGRMAQRLGERARVPAEATGLYRAVLLRSGKWEPGPPRLRPGGARRGLVGASSAAPASPPRRFGPSWLRFPLPFLPPLLPFITFLSPLSSSLSFLLSFLHSSPWGFV